MNFGKALEALKQGKKVTRKGWNGKGQFVYYIPADRYDAKTDAAKSVADEDGKVNYRAYLALKTAQGDIATWVPSISDCLVEDWEIVGEEVSEESEYPQYREGEAILYQNGDRFELGIVKRVCGDDEYFINYHTGDTAARTHARNLHKIENGYAFHVIRLDTDGNERR